MSETDRASDPVRLIVARCEVTYTGRLNAFLPESTRLLMLESYGSVLVHADAGGYTPLDRATSRPAETAVSVLPDAGCAGLADTGAEGLQWT